MSATLGVTQDQTLFVFKGGQTAPTLKARDYKEAQLIVVEDDECDGMDSGSSDPENP